MKEQTINPGDIGNRQTIRDNASRGGEIYNIALDKIVILKGFNVRTDFGDLEGLADSILTNGQAMPGLVQVLKNGTFALIDGERRYRACKILLARGKKIEFSAQVASREITEEQRWAMVFATQDNKQLTQEETSNLLQRYLTKGYNQTEIGKMIGRSQSWVSQAISFAAAPPQVHQLVKENKITPTTAKRALKGGGTPTEVANRIEKAAANIPAGEKVKIAAVVENIKPRKNPCICLGCPVCGAVYSVTVVDQNIFEQAELKESFLNDLIEAAQMGHTISVRETKGLDINLCDHIKNQTTPAKEAATQEHIS